MKDREARTRVPAQRGIRLVMLPTSWQRSVIEPTKWQLVACTDLLVTPTALYIHVSPPLQSTYAQTSHNPRQWGKHRHA